MSLAERLQNLLKEQKLTEADLGKQAGVSQQAINKIVKGNTQKPRHLVAIAAALQVDPIWLLTGIGPSKQITNYEQQKLHDLATIPVYQIERNHHGDYFLSSPPIITDRLTSPAQFATSHSLYAIYMPNSIMEPRFMVGELIIADTSRPPQMGEDCIICENTEDEKLQKIAVGRFIAMDDDNVITQQFNPNKENIFPLNQISLHRILRLKDII